MEDRSFGLGDRGRYAAKKSPTAIFSGRTTLNAICVARTAVPSFACVVKPITGLAARCLGYDGYEINNATHMSGLNATIILRKQVVDEQLGDVNAILRDVAIEFKHSRKGHHWDFTVASDDSSLHSYSLQLVATEKHPYDYEEELLQRDLDFDSAPAVFEIVAYCSNKSDQIVCETLAKKLTEMFGGINLGLRR